MLNKIKELIFGKVRRGENIIKQTPTITTTIPDEYVSFNEWAQHNNVSESLPRHRLY